ncbi:MAG: caspase family protein [Desulfuromonadaceae bacterium]
MRRIILKFMLLIAILVALSIPTLVGAADQAVKDANVDKIGIYHAILIGISKYNNFDRLDSPISDVEELGKILTKDYGFQDVIYITDKSDIKPTASNIIKTISDKAESLTENDNLLIYYAGHGNLKEKTKAGYWIPIDGKADDVSTWIDHRQVTDFLESENFKIKNFLLVADSCYSGQMKSRSIKITKGNDVIEMGLKPSRELITSGGVEAVTDAVKGSQHSLFAHYFLEALKDNKNRYIDAASLVDQKVIPKVKELGKQTPQHSRFVTAMDKDGFFVLTKLGAALPKTKVEEISDQIAALNARIVEQDKILARERNERVLIEKNNEELRKQFELAKDELEVNKGLGIY